MFIYDLQKMPFLKSKSAHLVPLRESATSYSAKCLAPYHAPSQAPFKQLAHFQEPKFQTRNKPELANDQKDKD